MLPFKQNESYYISYTALLLYTCINKACRIQDFWKSILKKRLDIIKHLIIMVIMVNIYHKQNKISVSTLKYFSCKVHNISQIISPQKNIPIIQYITKTTKHIIYKSLVLCASTDWWTTPVGQCNKAWTSSDVKFSLEGFSDNVQERVLYYTFYCISKLWHSEMMDYNKCYIKYMLKLFNI